MYVTRKSAFSVRNHLEVVVGPNRYGNMAFCHGSQSFVPAQIYLHSILVCPTNSSRSIWFWKSVKWFVHANDGTFCWKMRIESMHVFRLSWCCDLRSAIRNCIYQSTTCIPSHPIALPGTFAWRWSLCPRVPSAAWKRVLRQPVILFDHYNLCF